MSEPQHVTPSTTTAAQPPPGAPGTDEVRLELKPDGAAPGLVDGAWWPRSRDLRHELPGLIARLGERVGSVERVAFGQRAWEPTGKARLVSPAGRVAFDGFTTFTPDTVWVVVGGRRRARLCVVVIPPETDPTEAAGVLQRASAADNVASAAELLRGPDDPFGSAPPVVAAGAAR